MASPTSKGERYNVLNEQIAALACASHPSDQFNLDQDCTFDNKHSALQKGTESFEQWLMELDDRQAGREGRGA